VFYDRAFLRGESQGRDFYNSITTIRISLRLVEGNPLRIRESSRESCAAKRERSCSLTLLMLLLLKLPETSP
jgi:hypothetical protein